MKLKKLLILAYCVIVATMGITLTGCDLNIKGIIDGFSNDTSAESTDKDYESSSDTNTESSTDKDYENTDKDSGSSSDNENSSDANTESSNGGTWVQTEMKYYAYKNGEEPYALAQDDCYKYRCYYRGVTDDNFVKFHTSGGFSSSTATYANSHIDTYHLCSVPETSYPAGGLVTLQVRTYWENYEGEWYPNGGAWVGIAYENKEADMTNDDYHTRDPFLHNTSIKFYSALKDDYDFGVYENTSDTLTANMPEEAENGDRIAIVFIPYTATGYGGEYGVGSFVEWIYTYTENA